VNYTDQFQDGDIIFQTSQSNQSKAIQVATHSKFSHCGIIINKGKNRFVLEAVEPVRLTPIDIFIKKGKNNSYAVKRLKATFILDNNAKEKMKKIGVTYLGRHYDLSFDWSDEKIYCSELVWKIYKNGANIELGKLQQLKDFDLKNSLVQQKLKERYGKNIPYNEIVISPEAIFNSDKLETVFTSY
jgi:uncharacterized protein YycO